MTYWTIISTDVDLTSILVSSVHILFSEFWTFRNPSRLQRLFSGMKSSRQRTFHCHLSRRATSGYSGQANLEQKWKTA